MKYLKLFNESNFQVPSVDDVKTVFTSIIQDFIDNQKSDFKFLIKCNEWWGAAVQMLISNGLISQLNQILSLEVSIFTQS